MQPEEGLLPRPHKDDEATADSLTLESRTAEARGGHAPRRSDAAMVLLDPKPFTRRLIADMLAQAFPEYAIIAAGRAEELLNSAEEMVGSPTLIVIYVRSASVSDPFVKNALDRLRRCLPDVPVILLSDRNDLGELYRALTQGIRGYIPTSVIYDVAMAALKLIDAGGTYIPPDVIRSGADETHLEHEVPERRIELLLTPRELSVIELLREGKPNKLIAVELEMQESTVKVHVRNILRKLHASNRTHAVSVASKIF